MQAEPWVMDAQPLPSPSRRTLRGGPAVFALAAVIGASAALAVSLVANHAQRQTATPAPAEVSARVQVTLTLPSPNVLLEENFAITPRGWPNEPDSAAWYADAHYRLQAREPGRFVAIDAPTTDAFHDGVLSARFQKVGGPPGGGYGLIVADQGPDAHDGKFQGGRFVVFEAGDEGTVGAWERDENHWVDLLPWTPSPVVHAGGALNDLTVEAHGKQLTFLVNDVQVAQVATNLPPGRVGVFVGGDSNDVALEHFKVEWAMAATTSASPRAAAIRSGH